jgi:hypothetical protein
MRTSSPSSQAVHNKRLAAVFPQTPVRFANLGNAELTVIGPISGRRYHFASGGSPVAVDVRDQPMMAKLRQLRQVR